MPLKERDIDDYLRLDRHRRTLWLWTSKWTMGCFRKQQSYHYSVSLRAKWAEGV